MRHIEPKLSSNIFPLGAALVDEDTAVIIRALRDEVAQKEVEDVMFNPFDNEPTEKLGTIPIQDSTDPDPLILAEVEVDLEIRCGLEDIPISESVRRECEAEIELGRKTGWKFIR